MVFQAKMLQKLQVQEAERQQLQAEVDNKMKRFEDDLLKNREKFNE